MSMRVLVVDDDPHVRESLRFSLEFEGYQVGTAWDGWDALDVLASADARSRPDLVIMDLMMPGLDGLETCRRLRGTGDRVPVLMLTARDGLGDRITGLDAGADGYLAKPFALEELLARLRALLRQHGTAAPAACRVLRFEDLELNPDTREASRAGVPLCLTRTEFELLALLLAAPRRVLSRSYLHREVWGYVPTTNTLDVYVSYLRRKTEAAGGSRLIHTVRGVGYLLRA
jgi:two-component system response regulator MprA